MYKTYNQISKIKIKVSTIKSQKKLNKKSTIKFKKLKLMSKIYNQRQKVKLNILKQNNFDFKKFEIIFFKKPHFYVI